MHSDSATQVGPGTWLSLSYRLFDAEHDELTASAPDEPVTAVFGYGQLLPAIEQAIEGLSAGQSRSLSLSPERAFGKRDPKRVIEVDRAEFPPDVAAGDHYEVENETGELLVLKVLDVGDDYVVLDTNHPLAGQSVRVELTICAVRPATPEELAVAESGLAEEPDSEPPLLIGVERLLRGGTQR